MTYSTEMYGREAVKLIDSHAAKTRAATVKNEGFFLYLAFQDCHAPYSAPQRYLDRLPQLKGMRKYFNAMIAAVDDQVFCKRTWQ